MKSKEMMIDEGKKGKVLNENVAVTEYKTSFFRKIFMIIKEIFRKK